MSLLRWLRSKVAPEVARTVALPGVEPVGVVHHERFVARDTKAWATEVRREVTRSLAARPRPASRPKDAPD